MQSGYKPQLDSDIPSQSPKRVQGSIRDIQINDLGSTGHAESETWSIQSSIPTATVSTTRCFYGKGKNTAVDRYVANLK